MYELLMFDASWVLCWIVAVWLVPKSSCVKVRQARDSMVSNCIRDYGATHWLLVA